MAGRKSKATIQSEQHLANIAGSWKLKNYGNTISEDEYLKSYTIDFEKDIHVGNLTGKSNLTQNKGDFNSAGCSASVSLPFVFDPTDPESEGNMSRFKHTGMILTNMLEQFLGTNHELVTEKYERLK